MTKQESYNYIDNYAGTIRSLFITTSAGQDSVYLSKYYEALEYKNKNYPKNTLFTDYPFIHTESNDLNKTRKEITDEILAQSYIWKQIAAKIEGVRLKYKHCISLLDDSLLDLDIQIQALVDIAIEKLDKIATEYS